MRASLARWRQRLAAEGYARSGEEGIGVDTAEITLEKLDALRRRTGASYGACLEALRAHDGDVCAALADLEGSRAGPGRAVMGAVSRTAGRVWEEGMRTHVAVRHGGQTVVRVPAVVGVASAVFFPFATAVGVGAALVSHSSLSLERTDPTG